MNGPNSQADVRNDMKRDGNDAIPANQLHDHRRGNDRLVEMPAERAVRIILRIRSRLARLVRMLRCASVAVAAGATRMTDFRTLLTSGRVLMRMSSDAQYRIERHQDDRYQ
jgi:hypothetical protein